MRITSEGALSRLISSEIESESETDATASARTIIITVEDETAQQGEPRGPDEDEPGEEEPGEEEPGDGDEEREPQNLGPELEICASKHG